MWKLIDGNEFWHNDELYRNTEVGTCYDIEFTNEHTALFAMEMLDDEDFYHKIMNDDDAEVRNNIFAPYTERKPTERGQYLKLFKGSDFYYNLESNIFRDIDIIQIAQIMKGAMDY